MKDSGGAPLLSLKHLELVLNAIEPFKGKFAIDRVAVELAGNLRPRQSAGKNRLDEFFRQELAARKMTTSSPSNADSSPPFSLVARGSEGHAGGALRWVNESHGKPFNASVNAIEASVRKLDSQGSTPAEFDASWRLQAGEWLKGDKFSVKGGRIDLAKRAVLIDEIAAQGSRLLLKRAADGRIEFIEPPALVAVQAAQKDTARPWKVTVNRTRADDLALRFEDAGVAPAVTHSIERMKINAENLRPIDRCRLATRFPAQSTG